ncbi:MAG TPA: DUF2332 domain-containing protein [Ilumatobacteraceae bacterium]|nr:DUF2332 domain-containing protein [Ilumatobacteraceae bacterium]
MTATGGDSSDDTVLAQQFAAFEATARARAPLYAALAAGISRDRALSGLLAGAPPTQRLPVLLLAAVHDLLLEDPDHDLASWYPNLTAQPRRSDDPGLLPAFAAFVAERSDRLQCLLSTRTTQTNEVGRCGFLLPALGIVAGEVGPLSVIDVGTSGGLNLLLDRFEYRYRTAGGTTTTLGGPSTVVLEVDLTGSVPLPAALPTIAARRGIDLDPIDVSDESQARWLEACVWPDQAERFHRLVAAIGIARDHPPEIVAGAAVSTLGSVVEKLSGTGHPVVMNTWVLNYFTAEDRLAYLAELDRIGAERDLSWVYAEAPALTPELPSGPDPKDPHRTVLSLARWRRGIRTVEHLATVHPHGFWIDWR